MLNNVLNVPKTIGYTCDSKKCPYICIVFFIVLDLRLTKRLGQGVDPFFLPLPH